MKPATDYCRILGNIAFARGIKRAPALDAELTAFMYAQPRQIGDKRTIPEFKAWLAGWDEANLAA